jgi:hypothetical protein
MSSLFDAPQFNERQRNTLREQLEKALSRIRTDGSPDDWADVYIPPSHLQALDPQRMVVEGMRGSGKSFWTGVLTNREFRRELGAQAIGFDLKQALSSIQESHRIALDVGTQGTAFPNSAELTQLLALPGVKPETIWMVAILRSFPVDSELGMPVSTDKFDAWTAPVAWAGLNPARLSNGLTLLDQQLAQSRQIALVVIDAIDRASNDLSEVSAMAAGLLRVLLELRFAKGLRIKAFFREDVLSRASPSVVDGSKLLNNKVVLQWNQSDLYGLAFYRMAQHSPAFREQFRQITGYSWRQDSAQRYVCDQASNPEMQKLFWRALVGDYMGKAATKGHSYPYIFNHLSDGLGRVAPRIFLVALREALTVTAGQYAEKPYVIHHEAIKDGVRKASTDRAEELKTEYEWIEPALSCIRAHKETVPIDWATLEPIWLANNAAVLNEIEAMRNTALIPWRSDAGNAVKIESLRTTLDQIGVIKSRMKGDCERIEIPDIYRLAYKIGRKGGISTSKKI